MKKLIKKVIRFDFQNQVLSLKLRKVKNLILKLINLIFKNQVCTIGFTKSSSDFGDMPKNAKIDTFQKDINTHKGQKIFLKS